MGNRDIELMQIGKAQDTQDGDEGRGKGLKI